MTYEPESKNSSFPCPYCEVLRNKIKQVHKMSSGYRCSESGGCGHPFESRQQANEIRDRLIEEKTHSK